MEKDKTVPKKATHYIVTYHCDEQHDWQSSMRKLFDTGKFKCVSGQLERGKKTGKIHIQIYLGAKKQICGSEIVGLLPGSVFKPPKKFQIDPANIGPRMHEYCTKSDTRVSPEPLVLGDPPQRVDQSSNGKRGRAAQLELYVAAIEHAKKGQFDFIDPILYVQNHVTWKRIHVEHKKVEITPFAFPLRAWQSYTTAYITNPGDRKVLWLYDSDGNSGKSTFAKWLSQSPDTFYIDGGRKEELLFLIKESHNCLVVDLPRSGKDFVPYGLMETFKNGIWTSNKYEGNRVNRKTPGAVVVFSNFKPDVEKLSKDRWDILQIDKNKSDYIKLDWTDCIDNNLF